MTQAHETVWFAGRTARKAVVRFLIACMACLALPAVSRAQTDTGQRDVVIDSPRPLYELVLLLEQRYGVPVTLEEPVWVEKGRTEAGGRQAPDAIYTLKTQMRFVVPADLLPEENSAFQLATLNAILASYNRQGTDPVQFEAVSSEWGFHILPVTFRTDDSDNVAVRSPLDFRVHVESRRRLPSEHFRALCEAITASGGTRIRPWVTWMNSWFAAGGQPTPKFVEQLDEKQREPYTFAWGVESASGRSALLDLLKLSSTTLGWTMFCRAMNRPSGYCVLGVSPLQIQERDEQGRLVLDEKGKPRLKVQHFDRLSKIPLKRPPITIQ